MNKHKVYNFLVLVLFLGTSCYAMEPENMQESSDRLVIQRKLVGLELDNVGRLRCHPVKPEFVFSDVYGNNLSYYNLASNKLIANINYQADRLAYSLDGTLRAEAEYHKIHICDVKTNQIISSYDIPGSMLEIIFNYIGTKLVISLEDSIQVLDFVAKKVSPTAIDHSRVHCIVRSPDGKTFASAGRRDDKHGSVALWNLKNKKVDCLEVAESGFPYQSLAFNSDGTQLAVGKHDGDVHIWDLKNRSCKLIQSYPDYPKRYTRMEAIAYCAWTNKLFMAKSSSGSDSMDMIDLETNEITPVPQNPGKILQSTFSDDGSRLAQIVKDEQGDVYFRYTFLLPKKCYTRKERVLMAKLCKQGIAEFEDHDKKRHRKRLTDHD